MLKLVLAAIVIFGVYCSDEADEVVEYYWKEYFGGIPQDAVVAGHTITRQKVYIGQGYLRNWGVFVAQITPGVKEVYAPDGGINRIDKYIKILCGPAVNFYWMKVNSSTLHLSLSGKHAVIGGHEDKYGYMHIGRFNKGGNTIVGKVNSFWLEVGGLHYNDSGEEKAIQTFEVLMYEPPDPSILL